jgi:hypothetical protein
MTRPPVQFDSIVRLLLLVGCLVPTGRRNLVAQEPAASPLVTWEDLLPARGGVVLWARNPTSDTIWVDSLHVESCRNVRRRDCGTRALEKFLAPGASRELFRLAPAVPRDAFSYRWSLDWHTWVKDSTGVRRRRAGGGRTVVRT